MPVQSVPTADSFNHDPVSEATKVAEGDSGNGGKFPDSPGPAHDGKKARPDPTRFGDWERDGRCIDF
ncbi:MAG: hypothetical protein FD153_845 [Rhodospirillaceae bacterium]|nr:MAG: hypothetical protein FD153_845 [Rhodospirillaceae bacterium]